MASANSKLSMRLTASAPGILTWLSDPFGAAHMMNLFKRCVQCPMNAPSCPVCPAGTFCSQTAQSCDACASTSCVSSSTTGGQPTTQDKGPNVGAIAGGVVGGVAFIAIIVFLIWWFIIRRRRKQLEEEWEEEDAAAEKEQQQQQQQFNTMRQDARSSRHTVASMASTVLTRASNIIQIAYIPGVTNRGGGPGSPDLLVPPVPPIPASTIGGSSHMSSEQDQIFFAPGDLRDSTFTASDDGRSSYARTSIAPSLARSSVASTIYRTNAVVSPMPAQTIMRGKAAVVSVKSGSSGGSPAGTPGSETPPVPSVDYQRFGPSPRIQIPRSADASSLTPSGSVRSTNSSMIRAKPIALNIVRGKAQSGDRPPISRETSASGGPTSSGLRPLTEISMTDSLDTPLHARANRHSDHIWDDMESESDMEVDPHARARRSLLGNNGPSRPHVESLYTDIADTPGTVMSPFADGSVASPETPVGEAARLAPLLEDDHRRSVGGRRRGESPFSDEHEVHEARNSGAMVLDRCNQS